MQALQQRDQRDANPVLVRQARGELRWCDTGDRKRHSMARLRLDKPADKEQHTLAGRLAREILEQQPHQPGIGVRNPCIDALPLGHDARELIVDDAAGGRSEQPLELCLERLPVTWRL